MKSFRLKGLCKLTSSDFTEMTIPVFLVLSICKDFNLWQTGSVPAGPPTGAGGDHLNDKGGGSPHDGEAEVWPLEDGTAGVYVTWGHNEGKGTIVTSYLGLKKIVRNLNYL